MKIEIIKSDLCAQNEQKCSKVAPCGLNLAVHSTEELCT